MPESPGTLLNSLCAGANQLVIAAPYIKADALARVIEQLDSGACLTCITRWSIDDLGAGASDLECRTSVLAHGGSFQLYPSLHAKYYRIDYEVLVGSANLTASAMGWSRQPNLEILCRPGKDFDAHAFEQSLLDGAREVSDHEFARWETSVNIFAESDRQDSIVQPSLDDWRPTTRDPRHLELAYQGQHDQIASLDEQRAAIRDIELLRIPPGLSARQVQTWASVCLLATPFATAVLGARHMDIVSASQTLAEVYALSLADARRDMETVQNWLAFLAPDTLEDSP